MSIAAVNVNDIKKNFEVLSIPLILRFDGKKVKIQTIKRKDVSEVHVICSSCIRKFVFCDVDKK